VEYAITESIFVVVVVVMMMILLENLLFHRSMCPRQACIQLLGFGRGPRGFGGTRSVWA